MMRNGHFITKARSWIAIVGMALLFNSCNSDSAKKTGDDEAMDKGTIHISVDESFKPVMDSQIQVFESSYPEAKIIAHYKPEAECLRDFAVDSIRMIVATRGFTESEGRFMSDSMRI